MAPQPASFDPKNVTWRTRGPNRPFRSLDSKALLWKNERETYGVKAERQDQGGGGNKGGLAVAGPRGTKEGT